MPFDIALRIPFMYINAAYHSKTTMKRRLYSRDFANGEERQREELFKCAM